MITCFCIEVPIILLENTNTKENVNVRRHIVVIHRKNTFFKL